MKSDQAVRVTAAANLTTTQVTSSGVPQTLVEPRETRRRVLVSNQGTTTDMVTVGEPTVAAGKGTRIAAGLSHSFYYIGLLQVLAISGTPVVTAADEYD